VTMKVNTINKIKYKKYDSTNFLAREYANCMCFVNPFDVKMFVSKMDTVHYNIRKYYAGKKLQ